MIHFPLPQTHERRQTLVKNTIGELHNCHDVQWLIPFQKLSMQLETTNEIYINTDHSYSGSIKEIQNILDSLMNKGEY